MTTALERRSIRRAAEPPTERIQRVTPFAVREDTSTDGERSDGLTLDGYAATFNRRTLIDSWEGRFVEQIAPGSMKKTFREQVPRVQFDHGKHPMIGSIPIASVRSIAEETDPVLAPDGGAHIVARLFDNWLVEPVRDAIRDHAIDGMSFRFGVVREEWADPDGKILRDRAEIARRLEETWFRDVPEEELLVRTLREVKVPELGPVVWPAYKDTSVSVRSRSVVIDLAAARQGDPEERRKIADLLYAVDAPDEKLREPDADARSMEETSTKVPASTPDESGAASHTEETSDPPVRTEEGSQPPAASHASPHPRRDVDVALDMVRQAILDIPSEDPTRS